jgi:hypothetical protein
MSHRSHPTPASNAPVTANQCQTSPSASRTPPPSNNGAVRNSDGSLTKKTPKEEDHSGDQDCDDENLDEMGDRHRSTDGGRSHQPLLYKHDEEERGRTGYPSPRSPHRPSLLERSTMRSRSPGTQAKLATRKKYTYAAFFLGLSLISFVIQTETAVYIQHELGWNKAYCML